MIKKYMDKYIELIDGALNRTLPEVTHKEEHHIIPRCCDGTDDPDNLVDLTLQEHFEAHRLLYKTFPKHIGLMTAFCMMSNENQDMVEAEEYSQLKKEYYKLQSERMTKRNLENNPMNNPEVKKKHAESLKNSPKAIAQRKRLHESQIGKKLPPRSKKWCENISNSKSTMSFTIDEILFKNLKFAAKKFRTSKQVIFYRLKSNSSKFDNYQYV